MRLDSSIAFVPYPGPGLSMVAGPGVTIPSNVIDLMGVGVGVAPPNIIGSAALFGEDIGVGGGFLEPELAVATGAVAFATATGATLNVQLQAAPDTGAGGNYQPGAWQTLLESGALTAAQLLAATTIARFAWPPVFPKTLRPRFLRLNFAMPAAANFTAGSIAYALLTAERDDFASAQQAARNYSVS